MELQGDLHYARIAGGSDASKRRRAEYAIRIAKCCRIQGIENFSADLGSKRLPHAHPPDQRHIQISIPWSANRIARAAAERELRRERKCVCVEPPFHAPLTGAKLRIGYEIRPLRAKSRKRI